MKKSGMVLFISLTFITILSTLIIQNLNDTDNFIMKQNEKFDTLQLLIYANNIQKQISKYIYEMPKDEIDEFINTNFDKYLLINIEKTKIFLKIDKYLKININNIEEIKILLNENGIYSTERFIDILKNYAEVDTTKKLNHILEEFAFEDPKIYEIENKIGFFEKEELYYELFLDIQQNKTKFKIYYILNHLGEVKYFEINTK